MKKQEGKKNKLLWIVPAVLVAVLAVAGILLAVGLGGDEPAAAQPGWDGKLYWNVERADYFGQQLNRSQETDGTVYVRFAVDGEQVRLPVADAALVKHIDTLRVMGLVFDENGIVVDVKTVDEVTGGYFADGYYVEAVDGDRVTCNMTADFAGISKTFTMDADTQVIYASGNGILVGTPTTIAVDDEVIAIQNGTGKITHVYVIPYEIPADIYWNVNRMYNSTTKGTTRERNVLGYFEYELAVNGEIKTLYTRDVEVADAMDATAAKSFGLEFDEDGYITGVVEAKLATKGGYFASWYHVLELNGNSVYAKKFASGSDQGQTRTGTLSKNCKIFNVSGNGAFVGEPTTLQVGDQVHGLTDSRGQVCVLFVINRIVESELYWNVERMWDSESKLSTRIPDKNGWYHILLAVNGRQVTLKTRDKDIVQSMDAKADCYFGLEVTDGVITKYYHPNAATGGTFFASWCDVTEIKDGKVTALRTLEGSNKGTSYTATMADGCKVYNVSSVYDSFQGEETTLRVGDRIQGQTNYLGELVTVYVVNRLANSKMYWNVERMWDSEKSVSTRRPNEKGYYEILLAVGGEQKTYRTKDLELVNTMDGRADRHFGLKLKGDVITAVYAPSAVTGGTFFGSWYDITSIKGSTITVKRMIEGSSYGKTDSAPLAPGCEIYNVSSGYNDFVGEKTTLRVGDRIHGETNAAGQLVVVYVVGNRTVDAELYWNVDRKWDAENSISTRVPDEEGWYHILLAVNGQQVTLKTQDKDIVHSMDAKADRYFGLMVKDGVITRYCHPDAVTGGSFFASWYDVTKIEDGKVTAERTIAGANQGKTDTAVMAKDCKVYNVSSNYNEFVGEETQLLVTDRIQGQKNKEGQLVVIYVVGRTAVPEIQHTCTHVNEDVTWYAWNGKSGIAKGGHYVLTQDITLSAGCKINDNVEATLCLDGHTITTEKTAFTVGYGASLTLCDHKNEDGTYSGGVTSAYTGTSGGVFYVYDGGTMSIYGGNYTHTAQCSMAGIGGVGNKGTGATLNIYDGVFSGGNTTGSGGNFYIYAGATMNLYGGTITGGTAAANGGNIKADGQAVINIYGGTVENGTANSGGNIWIGTVARTSEVAAYARLNMTGGTVQNGTATGSRGGNIAIINAAQGSISGGSVIGGTSANDGGSIIVSRYDKDTHSDTKLTVSGGTITGGTVPGNGGSIWIYKSALSVTGGTVEKGQAKNGGSIFLVSGQLRIGGDALISGGQATEEGGNLYLSSGNVITISGGVIEKGQAKNGGNIVTFAQVDMTGGTIRDGIATSRGGNVQAFRGNNGTFTLGENARVEGGKATYGGSFYIGGVANDTRRGTLIVNGGTVTGGESSDGRGGSLYVDNQGTLTVNSGTFSGNVYVNTSGSVTLSGKTVMDDLYLKNGASIAVDEAGLTEDAAITLSMEAPGLFADADEALATRFSSKDEAYKVVYMGGLCLLSEDSHVHCVCGTGTHDGTGGHSCENLVWTPWGDEEGEKTNLPTGSGHYYLTEDIDLSAMTEKVNLAVTVEQHLCLNGHTITGPSGNISVWWVRNYLSICECQQDADGKDKGGIELYSKLAGALLHVFCNNAPGGMFELFGGNLHQNVASMSDDCGFVYVGNSGTNRCVFNMYGGTMSGAKASRNGGAVYVNTTTAVFNMYGGEIFGNSAKFGGAVYVNQTGATFNMHGGRIYENTATSGGAVYIYKGAFYMHEGTVTGCQAGNGGAVFAEEGTFFMKGGTLSDSIATANGGNLYVNTKGTGTIEKGTVSGGKAAHGGNLNAQGKLDMTGGTVTGGITAASDGEGGNLRIGGSGVFTMTGGSMENGGVDQAGNVVTKKGGNVQVFGKLLLQGGTISGGRSVNEGGNIAVWNGGSVSISDGTVTGGIAGSNGGNIFVSGLAGAVPKLEISGGTVSNGQTPKNGGNIYMERGSLTLTGGSVTGGTATVGGGIYVTANATLTQSGTPAVSGNAPDDIYEAQA